MNVAVIGLGLIGGSLLRALAEAGHPTVGYDTDPATRGLARTAAAQASAASRWLVVPSLRDAVAQAELVVLATPLAAVGPVLDDIANVGYAGLVTDVVSVKEPVRRLVADRLRIGGQRLAGYVGGHPMAGRETAGFAAADPALFAGCAWALCLDEETSLDDWLTVANLLTGLCGGHPASGPSRAVGPGQADASRQAAGPRQASGPHQAAGPPGEPTGTVRVVPTTAADHDLAVAAVSQVPHLLACALATAVADPLAATLAAGSFRDGTRVAASPPELVGAMCGGNPGPVDRALGVVLAELTGVCAMLDGADPIGAIRTWASAGHTARTTWPRGWGEPTSLAATAKNLVALGDDGGWVTEVSADRRTVRATRPV